MFDIRASNDFSFLHADRWEQLIVQHLPYLDKFSLFYQKSIVEKSHFGLNDNGSYISILMINIRPIQFNLIGMLQKISRMS